MRLRKKKNDIFIHCIKKNNLYNMSAENNKNILFWLNDAYLVSLIKNIYPLTQNIDPLTQYL